MGGPDAVAADATPLAASGGAGDESSVALFEYRDLVPFERCEGGGRGKGAIPGCEISGGGPREMWCDYCVYWRAPSGVDNCQTHVWSDTIDPDQLVCQRCGVREKTYYAWVTPGSEPHPQAASLMAREGDRADVRESGLVSAIEAGAWDTKPRDAS